MSAVTRDTMLATRIVRLSTASHTASPNAPLTAGQRRAMNEARAVTLQEQVENHEPDRDAAFAMEDAAAQQRPATIAVAVERD
jgi:hypothetical protein